MLAGRVLVGMFTEVYHPVVNGVVASIETLRAGLEAAGIEVVTFSPRASPQRDDGTAAVHFPSLPLPTSSGYRLCVPFLGDRDRRRLRALDIAHAHSPFVSGWFAASHARHARIPLIYTYHTRFDDYAHYAPFEPRVTRAAMIALTRAFANRAEVVIAPTRAMRERLRAIGVTSRIDVVPSAIDVSRFARGVRRAEIRALLGADQTTKLILAVARLGREKNLAAAIDAMPFLEPDLRLAIVGEGPQRAELEQRVAARGLVDRVRFVGRIETAAMPDVYAAADALVFTSTTETQGLVLTEAQAAGLAIAAVDTPVAREVLGARTQFAANEASALAGALARVVAGNAPGDRIVDPRFTVGEHTAAVRRLYESLLR